MAERRRVWSSALAALVIVAACAEPVTTPRGAMSHLPARYRRRGAARAACGRGRWRSSDESPATLLQRATLVGSGSSPCPLLDPSMRSRTSTK